MANKRRNTSSARAEENHFGKDLSFAASEAYKLLRTNLMFLTPGEKGHVVGVTSSVSGEGKSTTSINLAYALAESGRRVVLVECDMRRPTIARRLQFKSSPGLSNLIVGLSAPNEVLRPSGIHDKLFILPAGDIPPNPSELLGSERMRLTVNSLAADFDFVLIDLPPVTAVSDTLVAANFVDGMIVIVRQDVCTRHALRDTMRQLRVVRNKILGFVFTCAYSENNKYYKRRYYKRGYGYDYDYGYGEYRSYKNPDKKSDSAN